MKLFVIATLVAISTAARLEHLEHQQQRAYLPVNKDSSTAGEKADSSSQDSVNDDSITLDAARTRSSEYLPPNHGDSSFKSVGASDLARSLNGIEAQNSLRQQLDQNMTPQDPYIAQSRSAVNLKSSARHSSENIPQQSFDEQNGYQYPKQPSNSFNTPRNSPYGALARSQQQPSALNRQYFAPQFPQNTQQSFDQYSGYNYPNPSLNNLHASRSSPFRAQARYQPQLPAVNPQYFSSRSSNSLPQQFFNEQTGYQYPQQSFDEQTGYHY